MHLSTDGFVRLGDGGHDDPSYRPIAGDER